MPRWSYFRDHHYKSKKLSQRADTFVLTQHPASSHDNTAASHYKTPILTPTSTDTPPSDAENANKRPSNAENADSFPAEAWSSAALVGFVAVIPHNGGSSDIEGSAISSPAADNGAHTDRCRGKSVCTPQLPL